MTGKPAARKGDSVMGIDTHIVMIPSPGGPVPTPIPAPFNGTISDRVSKNVLILNSPAATKDSEVVNTVPHVPAGGPFQKSPSNKGAIQAGSKTVLINNKPAARCGDKVLTCNDPADAPKGIILSAGTVRLGD